MEFYKNIIFHIICHARLHMKIDKYFYITRKRRRRAPSPCRAGMTSGITPRLGHTTWYGGAPPPLPVLRHRAYSEVLPTLPTPKIQLPNLASHSTQRFTSVRER